jgi:hypothetical protein
VRVNARQKLERSNPDLARCLALDTHDTSCGPGCLIDAPPRPGGVTRVLAFDPGVHVGAVVLDVDRRTGRASLVTAPETLTPETCAARLVVLHELHRPDLVGIERAWIVHGHERMGSSYAQGLARENWVGGELAGTAASLGLPVAACDAATWRGALAGSRSATDRLVEQMVRLRCPSWPAPRKSNPHERDAAGVALWAGLQPAPIVARIDGRAVSLRNLRIERGAPT